MTWPGITINTIQNQFYVSEKRINKCKNYIINLLFSPYTTARKLAKFVGMIISMKFVIKSLVSLMTRFTYQVIASRITWDKKLNINNHNEAIGEILFWRDKIDTLNIRDLSVTDIPTDFEVHSVASENAVGIIVDNGMSCHRNLCEEERANSSTWRELMAVFYGSQVFRNYF